MKEYHFNKATVNVVNYTEFEGGDSVKTLTLDDTIASIAKRMWMGKSIFVGNQGRYACTSSMVEGFVNNPLGIHLASLMAISKAFERLTNRYDEMLMGWHLYDSGKGYYTISYTSCDRHYNESEDSFSFMYNPSTGRIDKDMKYYRRLQNTIKTLESALPDLIYSIQKLGIPIDLFEVCLIGDKYSEEGFYNEDGEVESYLCKGKMGSTSNTSYVLNGLSVISKENGFWFGRSNDFKGKYAMLVVM